MEVIRAAFVCASSRNFHSARHAFDRRGNNGMLTMFMWFHLKVTFWLSPRRFPFEWSMRRFAVGSFFVFALCSCIYSCLISLNCVAALKWRAITLSAYFIAVVVILIRCNFVLQTVFPLFSHIQHSILRVSCACGWENKKKNKKRMRLNQSNLQGYNKAIMIRVVVA